MSPTEKLSADTDADSLKHPERMRLDSRESIFEPNTLRALRSMLEGKRVVIIDQDGVMVPYTRERSEEMVAYPEAVEAVRELKAQGYTLVYWTGGKHENSEIEAFLQRTGIDDLFSVIITRENFFPKDYAQRPNILRAIASTLWLTEAAKAHLMTTVNAYRPGDPWGAMPKTPQCLVSECAIVDDNLHYYDDEIEDFNLANRYPLFQVQTRGRRHEDEPQAEDPSEFFGTSWITKITDSFPVTSDQSHDQASTREPSGEFREIDRVDFLDGIRKLMGTTVTTLQAESLHQNVQIWIDPKYEGMIEIDYGDGKKTKAESINHISAIFSSHGTLIQSEGTYWISEKHQPHARRVVAAADRSCKNVYDRTEESRRQMQEFGNVYLKSRGPSKGPIDGTAVLEQFLTDERNLPETQRPITEWIRNILNGTDPIANARKKDAETASS